MLKTSMENITTAEALEAGHGAGIRHLAFECPSGYSLQKALQQRSLDVTVKVCRTWLRNQKPNADIKYVKNAGHLEMQHGERIRSIDPEPTSGDELAAWLVRELSVSAPVRVCQQFLNTTWSSAKRTMTPKALETSAGERLRLR